MFKHTLRLVVLGLALLPVLSSGQVATVDPTSLDAVVAAAAAYVKSYQRELTAVLADEDYQQQIISQAPRDEAMPRVRRMRSEVFFMYAPAADDWMAIRDVSAVNGKDLKDRPNLREALRTLPPPEVARTFKAHNSRFNLGNISRNFNEPTLSLLILDDRYRPHVTFTRKRLQKRRDGDWVTVGFAEREGPDTLIREFSGTPAVSKGEFVVEAGTGRIRRAWMETTVGGVTAELTTDYAPDARLGIWVPARFTENYQARAESAKIADPRIRTQLSSEEIRCVATYTNYRRFEVKVTIR